jgi:amino-acid N-acetyltransferase
MERITIQQANSDHLVEIREILTRHNLPNDDIDGHIDNFLVASINGSLIGVIGVEIYDETALIRSLGVKTEYQGSGIGTMLYDEMLKWIKNKSVEEVFLLTTTAERYFYKKGFVRFQRNRVPEKIQDSYEFKIACPSSAVCMKLILS